MSYNQILVEEEMKDINTGFNNALFIEVPKWKNSIKNNLSDKDILSVDTTPDHGRVFELNKSFIDNLLSKDLIKRLEEASPIKNSNSDLDQILCKNKSSLGTRLSFDEENDEDIEGEDSETKASKLSKYSKDSKESFISIDNNNNYLNCFVNSNNTHNRKSSNSFLTKKTEEKVLGSVCERNAYTNNFISEGFKEEKSFEANNSEIYKGRLFFQLFMKNQRLFFYKIIS